MELKYKDDGVIKTPEKMAQIIRDILATDHPFDQEKEHFWVIGLTTNHCIQYIDLVSLGTLEASLVHPRETFRLAIFKGVESIIVVHNHISDNCSPSEADHTVTRRLVLAGEIIGIKLLDHIIVTPNKYLSFRNDGLI